MTEHHSALYAALAEAQAEFPAIPRTKEVTVRSDKGAYKFKYAPLEAIFAAVRAPLAKHGLSVFHRIDYGEGGRAFVVAVLAHKDGGVLECPFPVPMAGRMQEQGSAITYARRYTLQCALGIAADDDDDANAADGNHIEHQRETSGKRPPIPPSPAETKAGEIEARFRAAKDAATLARIGAENKAHIDAMPERIQEKLRAVYAERMNIVSPKKEAA